MAWTTDSTTATEIASAIAGSADQITQLNALANALGTGPRTLTIKHAASGDPWVGTTVYQATLTGANVVLAGKLRPGQITAQGVAAATNMASGSAVLRVSNAAGRYVQASLVLGGSTGFRIPASPAGVFGMVLGTDFGFAADPALAPAPDLQLATVTLHNETAGVQAADFVAPMFGAPFKQGDIPVGSYPHFRTAGGVACPATLHSITSWPDGSMKFCGVLLRVPATVPAGSTLAIQVRSGGAAPATGVRTTANLTAADLRIELVATPGPTRYTAPATPLTGTWTASLNDGITAATEVTQIANGPAGAIWRVWSAVKDTGNAAHKRLAVHHYVAALTNSAGGLLGLRYLGRVMLTNGDVLLADAPAHYLDFAATLKRGSTTIRALQGCADTPFPQSESATPGVEGSGYAGSETVGNVIRLQQYASFFTAGADAKWDFVQGGGTAAADCVVRATLDIDYVTATHMIPPYDRSIAISAAAATDYIPMGAAGMKRDMPGTGDAASIGILPQQTAQHILLQDAGHERVTRAQALAGGGLRYCVRKSTTRALVPSTSAKASYAGMGPITPWRWPSHATGLAIPTLSNSLWQEDAGHHPACYYWAYLFSGEPQFLDLQVELSVSRITDVGSGTRNYSFPSFAATGQGWDITIGGAPIRKGGGAFFSTSNGLREAAWRGRDIVHGAALLPDVPPDGVAVREYLRDCCDAGHAAMADYWDNCPAEAAANGIFWIQGNNSVISSPWMLSFYDWSLCMQSDILPNANVTKARQHMARFWRRMAETGGLWLSASYRMTAVTPTLTTDITRIRFIRDDAISVNSATNVFTFTTSGYGPGAAVTGFGNQWDWTPTNGDQISFGQDEAGGSPYPGWVVGTTYALGARCVAGAFVYRSLSAGNLGNAPASFPALWEVIGNERVNPVPSAAAGTTLYLINVNNTTKTFQVALTPGGAALPLAPYDIPSPGQFARPQNYTFNTTYVPANNSYVSQLRGMFGYHECHGDDVGTARTNFDTWATTVGINMTNYPKFSTVRSRT